MTSGSGTGGAALARCTALPAEVFAREHWGRVPLLTRRDELAAGFADLFSSAAADELVSRRGLRTPFLRMAKDGDVLSASSYTRGGGAGASIRDQAADDRILSRIDDGATLVLQALHRTWPPLVAFGSQLAGEVGHPVQINAYLTPPANQGFAPHYDVHDVFVLQVAGSKRWTIHEPVVLDPLDDQPWEHFGEDVSARAAAAPIIDTVLEPGDSLYLPRGTIHSAKALGQTAIHLTVGIHPVTRNHLVRFLLEAAADVADLRSSLPMGSDLGDPDVLAPHLAATVAALSQWLGSVDPAAIAARVDERLMQQTRPEPIGPFAQLAAADALGSESSLRLRGALRSRLVIGDEDVRIVLPDRTITLPVAVADALKIVLAGVAFVPAELPGLDASEQLVVCRRLLREAVIVPA